jgi:hypothetical protein
LSPPLHISAVGSGHTFAANGVTSYHSIAVAAFNHTDTTANAQNETGAGNASATTQQPGSLTPPTANSLVVTALEMVASSGAATINSGFTVLESTTDADSFAVALAYLVQTSASAVNPTWTAPGAADRIAAAIASFKAAP